MATEIKDAKKRNVWSADEVRQFLVLIKEKHVLGLMDGKRLRVGDIFKTLVAPMKEAGFARDVGQLSVKWKNLKAEYYKCRRHNGTDPAYFEYYEELDELLGQRPAAQAEGYETTQSEEVSEHSLDAVPIIIDEDDPRIEIYEDSPDVDGAIPGCSKTPGIQKLPPSASPSRASTSPSRASTSRSSTPSSQKTKKKSDAFLTEWRNTLEAQRREEAEADKKFLETFLNKQEEMMLRCTQMMMRGMQQIFNSEYNEDSE